MEFVASYRAHHLSQRFRAVEFNAEDESIQGYCNFATGISRDYLIYAFNCLFCRCNSIGPVESGMGLQIVTVVQVGEREERFMNERLKIMKLMTV